MHRSLFARALAPRAGSFAALAGLSVGVALFAACPPPTPPPPPPPPPPTEKCVVDTNFPNQVPASAVDLDADTPVQGLLCPAHDDDGYRVHVDAPGSVLVVTLKMDTNISNVNPAYSVFKDDGGAALTALGIFERDPDESQGHATDFTAANRVEDAGDYVIDVADAEGLDDGFDNVNKYTLTVSVVADPDVNEPNNVPAAATPITSGTPITGQIATSGDQDWYALTVSGGGQIIDVTVTVPALSGVEHVVTLFAPDAQTIIQTAPLAVDPTDDTKETVRLRKAAVGPGTGPFLLEVVDGGADGDQDAQLDPAKGAYTVTATVLADPDTNEGTTGNESTDTATPIAASQAGVNATGSIASFADRDVYKITPPAGTTRNAPQVLLVDVVFDAAQTIDASFKPQVRVVGGNPDDGPATCTQPNPNPTQGCTECYDGPSGHTCAEDRLQRFVKSSTFHTAFPLRNTEPVFVEINEFNDDAFQDGTNYTATFKVIPDPDGGEHGDDALVQNLEFAGFSNQGTLNNQYRNSRPHARQVALGFQPVCSVVNDPTVGLDPACIDIEAVPHPVANGFPATQVSCGDTPSQSTQLTGKLTYEGDRDFFELTDYPDSGYMNLDIKYSVSASTPVELTIFVHGDSDDPRDLAGSTIEAQALNGCSEQQGGQNACAAGSLCVDGTCWTDIDTNPSRNNVNFGAPDACINPLKGGPLTIEVVDNGINDFDENMTYTLQVTASCGCPGVCDTPEDFCQDGL